MRWLLVGLSLVASFPSVAAELVVESDRPVVVVVNFKPHTVAANNSVRVDIPDHKHGNQGVTIRSLLGEQLHSAKVAVARQEVVYCRWSGRSFEIYKRETQIASAPAPAALPRPAPRPSSVPVEPAPIPTLGEDVHLAAVEEAADPEAAPAAHQVEAGPISAPASGQVGKVLFVGRTTSWSNVFVDGELLHEFRGDRDFLADLPTGIRQVTMKDFQNKNAWAHGRLFVYPDFQVELQFGQHAEPSAINRPEAWQSGDIWQSDD